MTSYCSYARPAQPGPNRTRLCGPCIAALAGFVIVLSHFVHQNKLIFTKIAFTVYREKAANGSNSNFTGFFSKTGFRFGALFFMVIRVIYGCGDE